jgi:hypothetical protein
MKTPIILISTKGKPKEQLLKESRMAIRKFLKAKEQAKEEMGKGQHLN